MSTINRPGNGAQTHVTALRFFMVNDSTKPRGGAHRRAGPSFGVDHFRGLPGRGVRTVHCASVPTLEYGLHPICPIAGTGSG